MKLLLIVLVKLFVSVAVAKQFTLDHFKIEVLAPRGFQMKSYKDTVRIEQTGLLEVVENTKLIK
jgi:hypothetical protein